MFHVSLLEQNTLKKKQIGNQANQTLPELEKNLKFEAGDNKEY